MMMMFMKFDGFTEVLYYYSITVISHALMS